jgi:hypothetical protein
MDAAILLNPDANNKSRTLCSLSCRKVFLSCFVHGKLDRRVRQSHEATSVPLQTRWVQHRRTRPPSESYLSVVFPILFLLDNADAGPRFAVGAPKHGLQIVEMVSRHYRRSHVNPDWFHFGYRPVQWRLKHRTVRDCEQSTVNITTRERVMGRIQARVLDKSPVSLLLYIYIYIYMSQFIAVDPNRVNIIVSNKHSIHPGTKHSLPTYNKHPKNVGTVNHTAPNPPENTLVHLVAQYHAHA